MYTKNGPPLPLDPKLRLPHHISSLYTIPVLRSNLHDLPLDLPLGPDRIPLGPP